MRLLNSKGVFLLSFFITILYALLIFKDPFSARTLIPNFEPFPDTFNYINPALSLVKGKGFSINRDDRILKPVVSPLYSLSLVPFFFLRPDPRMAYYANVVLAFISLLFFWLILQRIFTNRLIIFFLLILYSTSYFIYWVPSIIMAENLTLPLYLAAIFLLLSKSAVFNLVSIAVLIVAIYATKYANIPLSVIILLICLLKIFSGKMKEKRQIIFYSSISFVFAFTLLLIFETVTKGVNILSNVSDFLRLMYSSVPKNSNASSVFTATSNSWFGIGYIKQNLPMYIKILLGSPSRFLWDSTPIVPGFVGVLGLFGTVWNIFQKKYRFICVVLFALIFSLVLFMSTFYTYDARYIYIAIPSLIIGFGIFLTTIERKIFDKKRFIFNSLIIVFIMVYFVTNFVRIKSQISLNLKYTETPWYYIAVLKMNEYFTIDKTIGNKKPILISALPPFLIDYYSNGNYTLLPLSYEQEFRGQELRQIVWGVNDYSDLPKLYKKYLMEGFNVYVSRAGLGNEGYTNRDFNIITQEFDTKLVLPGCFEQCNIYSVKLKDEKSK